MVGQLFSILLAVVLSTSCFATADEPTLDLKTYQKAQVLLARYGGKEKQELFAKAMTLRAEMNKRLVGQDALAAVLQIRIIQYLSSVGTRKAEPIALHMIGLPGVGKTSVLNVLQDLGFPIVRIDAQKFPGGEQNNSNFYLMRQLETALELKKKDDDPLFIYIDEVDKVPEIEDSAAKKETNQPVVSALNEILSEGKLSHAFSSGRVLNFSNVFVLTAMNFSPLQIQKFSGEILGGDKEKSFWDFTEADMAKFDTWIRNSESAQSAVAKILALLFRANTISRLIPDTMVVKALFADDFTQIVKQNIDNILARLTQNNGLRVQATPSDAFVAFLRKSAVFAPSGARMTVKKVDLLTEQLVTIALHSDLGSAINLSLPKKIVLDFDPIENQAVIQIEAMKRKGATVVTNAKAEIKVKYNSASGSFEIPQTALKPLPTKVAKAANDAAISAAAKKATGSQIRAQRNKLKNDRSLEKYLNTIIFDQPEIVRNLDEALHLYMNSEEDILRYLTIPGFTGTGKTAAVLAAAEKLKLPVVKMNMQEYSGTTQEAATAFAQDLFERISEAKMKSPVKGKYVLLIEEVDKANEINQLTGEYITRPALAILNDLLDKGKVSVTVKQSWSTEQREIDIRQGFPVITMNFPMERFDLKADPRLTSIEDMQEIYEKITGTPEDLRALLSGLFRDHTVNRLLSVNTQMAKPLTRLGYEKILLQQAEDALIDLSASGKAKLNHASLKVKMTKSYLKQYLFAEAVIPADGGRQAAVSAKAMLLKDIRAAIQALPKTSPLYSRPIEIILDYAPRTETTKAQVLASARLSEAVDIAKRGGDLTTALYQSPRQLRFPPLKKFGALSVRRVLVSTHEFGHAFAAVMHGQRFEHAVGVPPSAGIGGYVKLTRPDIVTGRVKLAELMSALGSIAMERIVLSEDPISPESMLDITTGPEGDIKEATKVVWKMLHQFGMDPEGGLIERTGLGGDHREKFDHRDFFFAELPDKKIAQLSMVVRDMLNHLTKSMVQAHSQDWYKAKWISFAQQGGFTEAEFYKLIDYTYPGANRDFIGQELRPVQTLKDHLKPVPAQVQAAREFLQGDQKQTAAQNLEAMYQLFLASLKKHVHSDSADCEAVL